MSLFIFCQKNITCIKKLKMIKTKASLAREKEAKGFKTVKLEVPKRLPKTLPPNGFQKEENSEDEAFNEIFGDGPKRNKPRKDKNQVTFDSARREILNYGLSNKSVNEKSDQTAELLMKLGAKPSKKKARNYKEILEEKRKEKLDGEKINKRTLFGTSATLQYRNQSKKRDDGLLKRYGRVEKRDRDKIKKSFNNKKK